MMNENDFIALARERAGALKRREKRRRSLLWGTALPVLAAALCLAVFWARRPAVYEPALVADGVPTAPQEERQPSGPEEKTVTEGPLTLTLKTRNDAASSLYSAGRFTREKTFEGDRAREALALLRALREKREPQLGFEDGAAPADACFEFSNGETFLLRLEKGELVSGGRRYSLEDADLAALNALMNED